MIDADKLKEIETARADAAGGYGSVTTRLYADHVGLLLDERAVLLAERERIAAYLETFRCSEYCSPPDGHDDSCYTEMARLVREQKVPATEVKT